MYFEEVEWCVRATRAGFRILHVPEAKVWHKISPEQQFASPRITYYMTRNHLLFLKKTGAGPTAWAYTLLDGILRPLLSWSIKPKWRHKRNQRDAMLRGFLDYCRGRFGRAEIK
jgi:GT2 family glycosyltransferase